MTLGAFDEPLHCSEHERLGWMPPGVGIGVRQYHDLGVLETVVSWIQKSGIERDSGTDTDEAGNHGRDECR